MILEQAERDRVQQLLCETLPAICQASLSGFADIKVDALIGITLNKSDVFLVSVKETCHPDGGGDSDDGRGGRSSKVSKIMTKTEGSGKRSNGRGRRKKAKRAASESEEEYVPVSKGSQKDEDHETSTEQTEESPRKRSRVQRKSAVKAEASFQEPDDNESPELPPDGMAEFSDDDFGGATDDGGDFSDIENDDESEMTDIRQQIDNQEANLDRMMIKQEPGSTDKTTAEDGDNSVVDRNFTASKASDDQTEKDGDHETSTNEQISMDSDLTPLKAEPLWNETEGAEEFNEGRSQLGKKASYVEISPNLFQCADCIFTAKHKHSMYRHRRKHSGIRYNCKDCPSKYPSKYELRKHEISAHENLQCQHCSKRFRSEHGLKGHLRIHAGLEYKCGKGDCDRKFSSKGGLVAHENVHSGIKPYVCSTCKKAFNYQSSWQRHEKGGCKKIRPKKVPNTSCDVCKQIFKCVPALQEHKRAKHLNQNLKCKYCSASFIWRNSHYRHTLTCKRKFGVE